MAYSVGRSRIPVHSLLRTLSCLLLDRFVVEDVWCLLCPGVLRGDDRDMLAVFDVFLPPSLGSSSLQTGQVGGGSGLHYRPSPGFHQKVRIRSLRVHASFLVRVAVRSRIPLILASTVLVYG